MESGKPLERISPFLQQYAETLPARDRDLLLRQFLYSPLENQSTEGFVDDPLEEETNLVLPGIYRKYSSRILVLVSDHCPVLCRYCTRKRITWNNENRTATPDALRTFLSQTPEIHEVIFSGGDPLMKPTTALREFSRSALSSPSVHTLRIHSRVPTTLPGRFKEDLFRYFSETAEMTNIFLVLHINHASEISPEAAGIFRRLKSSGVHMLSQSVFLKGVNDNLPTLKDLILSLLQVGVRPYYLHQLDRVLGSAHFEQSDKTGCDLMKELAKIFAPHSLPFFVRDSATGKKTVQC